MAYETKALLVALANIVRNTRDAEKIYEAIQQMANVEGIILKPLDEDGETSS